MAFEHTVRMHLPLQINSNTLTKNRILTPVVRGVLVTFPMFLCRHIVHHCDFFTEVSATCFVGGISCAGSKDESGCRYEPPTRSAQVKYCP